MDFSKGRRWELGGSADATRSSKADTTRYRKLPGQLKDKNAVDCGHIHQRAGEFELSDRQLWLVFGLGSLARLANANLEIVVPTVSIDTI